MISRRSIILGLGSVIVAGCVSDDSLDSVVEDKPKFLDQYTIAGFKVDASSAAVLGASERLGRPDFAMRLQNKLNSQLAGSGTGDTKITLSIDVSIAYAATNLVDRSISSSISSSEQGGVFGNLKTSIVGSLRTLTDEEAIDGLVDEYVEDMRNLLQNS